MASTTETANTAASTAQTTTANVTAKVSEIFTGIKEKFPGVSSKVDYGVERARSIATEVTNDIQKTATNNNVNSPLPADFVSQVLKADKILSSFTDPEKTEGLVVAKIPEGGWSCPSLINIGGVGFGAQLGADVTDFVIVLNTDDAVKAFAVEKMPLCGRISEGTIIIERKDANKTFYNKEISAEEILSALVLDKAFLSF
ncbi:unnamed protein product [Rhizophagus irregularis]|nr:unnamed protein product [Rhizophagus irregularis]